MRRSGSIKSLGGIFADAIGFANGDISPRNWVEGGGPSGFPRLRQLGAVNLIGVKQGWPQVGHLDTVDGNSGIA